MAPLSPIKHWRDLCATVRVPPGRGRMAAALLLVRAVLKLMLLA